MALLQSTGIGKVNQVCLQAGQPSGERVPFQAGRRRLKSISGFFNDVQSDLGSSK